jgi:hypothetical protein
MAEKLENQGLYKKLAVIMGEIGKVEKKGYNSFHKYHYVTESDLTDVVRDKLSSRGIVIIPSLRAVQHEDTLTTALMGFTFVDSETGERETCDWAGTGDDKGDKGLYKAYTGSLKYFLMKMFLISQGDDPEADTATDRRAEASGNACPKCGKVRPVIKGKEEYGGGWVCFKKKGGCGATWQDADDSPGTPPAASLDDAAMNALRQNIKAAMQALNDAGDAPEWTVQRVNEMSKLHFGDVAARLDLAKLGQLAEMFSQRLEAIRKDAAGLPKKEDVIASIQASAQDGEIESYLKEHHAGAALDSLNLQELDAMDKAIGIPF